MNKDNLKDLISENDDHDDNRSKLICDKCLKDKSINITEKKSKNIDCDRIEVNQQKKIKKILSKAAQDELKRRLKTTNNDVDDDRKDTTNRETYTSISGLLSHSSSTESIGRTSSNSLENINHNNKNLLSISSLTWNHFTFRFWILCLMHMTFSNMNHLFNYISTDFIYSKWNTSINHAVWLSSLSSVIAVVLCPIASLYLDHVGYKMYVCALTAVLSTISYFILGFSDLSPIYALVVLSLSVAFVPTILRSSVPQIVDNSVYGTAYGIYEISESLGAVIGHVSIGFIRDYTDSYQMDLMIFAILGIISFLLTMMLIALDKQSDGSLNKPMNEVIYYQTINDIE